MRIVVFIAWVAVFLLMVVCCLLDIPAKYIWIFAYGIATILYSLDEVLQEYKKRKFGKYEKEGYM